MHFVAGEIGMREQFQALRFQAKWKFQTHFERFSFRPEQRTANGKRQNEGRKAKEKNNELIIVVFNMIANPSEMILLRGYELRTFAHIRT